MPFNLVAICVFLPKTVPKEEDISEGVIVDSIDWYGVGKGIALSMGQVYAINDMAASTLMNIAVFLYSPLLFITSTIGAIVGSLAGKYLKTFSINALLLLKVIRLDFYECVGPMLYPHCINSYIWTS